MSVILKRCRKSKNSCSCSCPFCSCSCACSSSSSFAAAAAFAPNPTKFYTTIKTIKYSSWVMVIQTRVWQIIDGGRPPSWKVNKPLYLSNDLTDRHEIWQDGAFRLLTPYWSLKSNFNNLTWRIAASLKIKESPDWPIVMRFGMMAHLLTAALWFYSG